MTAELASKWFEEVPSKGAKLAPGRFCHVPIPYTVEKPLFVDFGDHDEQQSTWLVALLWESEGGEPWDHAPVKELNLHGREEYLAAGSSAGTLSSCRSQSFATR